MTNVDTEPVRLRRLLFPGAAEACDPTNPAADRAAAQRMHPADRTVRKSEYLIPKQTPSDLGRPQGKRALIFGR